MADIEVCLRSRDEQLYHLGFRSTIAHSTLADVNNVRDWRIYADLAQVLIRRARRLYAEEPLGVELNETVYALDSTTIDLCLSLFPWARFRSTKAAIKLHTLLDVRGPIPTMIAISEGKQADVRIPDELIPEPGAFYVVDRGYVDFARLHHSRDRVKDQTTDQFDGLDPGRTAPSRTVATDHAPNAGIWDQFSEKALEGGSRYNDLVSHPQLNGVLGENVQVYTYGY